MEPHDKCLMKLQELIGCACIGDALNPRSMFYIGVKKESKMKKQKKDLTTTLLPRHLWEERRRMDLVDAMAKLVYNHKKIPNAWICELEELNDNLEESE